MSLRNRILALLVFAFVVFLSGGHGQLLWSLISLILLAILCGSALPLARLLFPDRARALLFAGPIGYLVHAVMLSLAGNLFGISVPTFAGYAVIALAALAWLQKKRPREYAGTEDWEETDTFLLLLWILASLLLVALPFWNVGVLTPGGYAYRAYFNADFFRNMSVAGALSSTGIPPDNPYVSGFVLNYYWFFHILLAFWQRILPGYRLDFMLVQFSLSSMSLFVMSLFAVIRGFSRNRRTLVALFPLFAFGGSYEGIFILKKLSDRHLPWGAFTQWNVDGILRWLWNAPQVDTLYRALLYAPQHLLSLCVFLILLPAWNEVKSTGSRLFLLSLVFASVGFSAFVGAALVITSAVWMLVETARQPRLWIVPLLASGGLGLAFLALYLSGFQMFQSAGGLLQFGPDPVIAQNFIPYFVLNWGALLPLGLAGIALSNGRAPVRILTFFVCFCFALIVCVKLNLPGGSDVSLKMGHFSHVALLLLAAGFLDRMWSTSRARLMVAVLTALILPALVTWWMDAYNSRDVSNAKFTTIVKPQDMTVYRWMNENLPGKARIQNYAQSDTSFLHGFVSEIPPFAQRSLYLGDRNFSRIFQVPQSEVDQRRKMLSVLIREKSPRRLWELSTQLGIDYYYWGSHDSVNLALPGQKFVEPYFSIVMQQDNAFLFRVNPNIPPE